MSTIIDVRPKIHKRNVCRIANNVLVTIGANHQDKNLSNLFPCPITGLNNWFLVVYIINRIFPSPTLNKVQNPTVIENIVIEVLVRESLITQKCLLDELDGNASPHTD